MAVNKNKFEDITGMWQRRKTNKDNTVEVHWYGQIRENISLNKGDKIHLYETRNRNRKSTDPQYHLKVLRAAPDSED